MKVAIVGAGWSGLSCALELESHQIYPDIYEQKSQVGELFPHVTAILEVLNRPVKEPLIHLSRKYNITLPPLAQINSLTMKSAKATATVKGDLGFYFLRGQEPNSVENQLAAKIQSPIYFNQKADYYQLKKAYDYVVVATGNKLAAAAAGVWTDVVDAWVKGATILGNFNPNELLVWFNTSYAKSGYGWLAPFDNRRASLDFYVPYTNPEEIEILWEKFLVTENLNYKIVQTFTLAHVAGLVKPAQLDNVIFIGIAGGLLEPFLGFGQFAAVISGVLAGKAIAYGKDYNKLFQVLYKKNQEYKELRKLLDTFTNEDFDKLIKTLDIPVLNQIIYNSNLNVISPTAKFVKAVNFFLRGKPNQYKNLK